jgi:hypothetical protein
MLRILVTLTSSILIEFFIHYLNKVIKPINQSFSGNRFNESFHVEHFLFEPLEIGHRALIFSMCDREDLNGIIFGNSMIPYTSRSTLCCLKNFTHCITILYDKLYDASHILYVFSIS